MRDNSEVEVIGYGYKTPLGWVYNKTDCDEGEPLMTVAQHQCIVAAKDAEIASERKLRRDLSVRVHELKDEVKELQRKSDLFDQYAVETEELGCGGIGEVIDALAANLKQGENP